MLFLLQASRDNRASKRHSNPMKTGKIILLVLAVVLIAIQFVPSGMPENKPEDEKSIVHSSLINDDILNQLRKSCFDCHSNQTVFPWYSKLAPSSWFLADHISEGKSHLNFSDWADYSNSKKIELLGEIADEVESGKMPLRSYLLIHRDAKLNSEEISALAYRAKAASFILQTQISQSALDQARLMKQFEGTWNCEIGKDTSAFWDMEPYGSGYLAGLKYVTKGKIVREGKGLYGYDKKIDKIVEAGITIGKDIGVYVMWFISDSNFMLVPFSNLANPEKASFKMEGEFKYPDILVENTLIENKIVNTKTWTKSKR